MLYVYVVLYCVMLCYVLLCVYVLCLSVCCLNIWIQKYIEQLDNAIYTTKDSIFRFANLFV